ncbi:uncharacterized protein [Dermacentor andersoni]|uniref:uncharacterized protein n=1 Tax=Dermacentor andersoni TaxID=34620 RepID=UPI00241602B2|nr:uncharacterized protein LOC129380731 [Dermacentor andersoni]
MAAAFDVDDKPPERGQAWPLPMHGAALAEPVSAGSESQIVTDATAAERISSVFTATSANEGSRQAQPSTSPRAGRPPRLTGRALVPDQVFLVWAILALFMMIGLVGLASFYIFLQSNHLYSIPAELARQRNTTRARV